MKKDGTRGFTLIEVILALAILSMLLLASAGLSSGLDRFNQMVRNRSEAEHSGQATLTFISRELQTATAFYLSQAAENAVGYRKSDPSGAQTYCRLRINGSDDGDHRLYLDQFPDSSYTGVPASTVIADGICDLSFRYYAAALNGTIEIPPSDKQSGMFYLIDVTFAVQCGHATVALQSALATLNNSGMTSPGNPDEVVG